MRRKVTVSRRRYMDERAQRIDDYILQLEQLRINDSEEYNLVKIKLETDVQVLEQQLQQVSLNLNIDASNISAEHGKA